MRGNHFILMDGYMDFRIGAPPQPDPRHEPTRRAMGFARQLAQTVDLASFEPRPQLSSTGYCLAAPGREYLVYQPQGGRTFTLTVEPGTYDARWLDCSTSERSDVRELELRGRESSFTAPFANPAVLHLKLRTNAGSAK